MENNTEFKYLYNQKLVNFLDDKETQHTITFTSNIDTDDAIVFNIIKNLLIKNGYTKYSHYISFK